MYHLNFCLYELKGTIIAAPIPSFCPSLFYLVSYFFLDVVEPVRPPDISHEDDSGFIALYITALGAVYGSLIDGTCFITRVSRTDKRSFVYRSDMWWCTIVQ